MPDTHVRYRKRDASAELYAGLALLAFLALILLGARWLVQHRPAPAAHVAAAPSDAQAANPNDPVVIEVNGEPVRQSEFVAAVAAVPAQMRAGLESEAGKKQLAEELVKMKLLEQYARRVGLDRNPELAGRMGIVRGNLLASAAMRHILETTKPLTPLEIYEKNKSLFEVANVKSIVIPYEGSAARPRSGAPLPLAQARAKAVQLVARLRAGEDFGAVARAESADNAGGELGEVARGSMPAELDQVVFSIPIGQVSEPLQSPFGFHIFKVTDRKTRSFEELKPLLEQEAKTFQANEVLADLRKGAKVEFKKPFFGG
jgi:peptidyl-prolyl cis-trans isomerase C